MKNHSKFKYAFGEIEIGNRAQALVAESFKNHWVSGGPHVKTFEDLFRKTFSYKEAVATSSGTTAGFTILASIHDLGASWGDEVIVPALSFVATSNAVMAAGFKPVFVDIQRNTLNIDPNLIERSITKKTKAIQVVHTMGKPCDMQPILEIAKKYKLFVLEDSCEAHGAQYRGHTVASMGLAGNFSFYTAHMICTAEGGMIATQNEDFSALLRSVRSHGRPDGTDYFQFDRFGFNCKMNDLEAALGIEGIENFEKIFKKRKNNLNYLLDGTKDLSHLFYFLEEGDHEVISPHGFSLVFREDVLNEGSHLSNYLIENGIQVKTLFGSLPTQHHVFKFLGYQVGEFPQAEYVGLKGIHVGCHQYLEKSQLDYFIDHLHQYVHRHL
ncbi:MAG: DegT/DnrJ/EryC1/StrS family aminotransferase [Deltaproteobacteria bacterium]|nr:DegT/DnrJ/EryC1/StrS family aminotransferase [Deltaproteobacteria bacterium]